jgi:membrane associated rhomboid family serine protease
MEYPVTVILIAANVILSIACFNNQDLMAKMIMWPYGVKRYNQYYRFITSGFIHANWMHLIFNMFTLYFFGRVIEAYFTMLQLGGIAAYLVLYFLGLILSDLPTYFKYKDDPNYHSLGASGAVSAVVFAAIVFNPWSSLYIFGAIKISAFLYAVLYIWYSIYMSKKGGDNINHDAHLYGALFGLGFTIALIGAMQPQLFEYIIEELKKPSLLGR